MRKVSLFIAVLAFGAALFFLGGFKLFTNVSAQETDASTGSSRPAEGDASLATLIKRLTDRSTDGLTEHRSADGTVGLDLGEGFQNVMVARSGADGEPVAACVTSLGEANAFFGRDLETGAPKNSMLPEKNEAANLAARHGMSEKEFLFFKKMIEDAAAQRAASPESASLNIVNGDGAGEGFNEPTVTTPEGGNNGLTRGEQRVNLFQFAASIWGAYLDSSVPINVNSQFNPLSPCTTSGGVLGSAGATNLFRDYPNAGFAGTWHHVALANKQAGTDLNSGAAEINARFNTDVDNGCLGSGSRFYYGLNNSTPSNRVNLLVVLLHEMGHGLGFSTSVSGTTGALNGGFPDAFLLKMFDRTTGKYWKDMTNTERQASALNSGNVLWDGANVKIASAFMTNGNDSQGRVQLYTPSAFEPGSSISHFNTASSPNLLMEPNINLGLPLDLDLSRQLMRDIGWYRDTTSDLVPDTITAVSLAGAAVIGAPATVRWTNNGSFARNVSIELSTDGGNTFPISLATDSANTGSFTFTVPNTPTGQARLRVREAGFVEPAGSSAANFTIGSGINRTRFDYDGDGKADVSVFRPSGGDWYLLNSSTGYTGQHFGQGGDLLTPADLDGDGKTDVAVFRASVGGWYWLNSSNGSFSAATFGQTGDLPTPADYDGDGKADIAVFRPSTGDWYRMNSSNGQFVAVHFGSAEDKPALGDFDGDGKADISIFRPSTGSWYRLNSSNGEYVGVHFGVAEDKPTPADYDGDGKTDISVFRPSVGDWFRLNSSTGAFAATHFGGPGDKPAAADFDGDGKADITVFRPSDGNWYQLNTTAGFGAVHFGIAGDLPTPNAFVY